MASKQKNAPASSDARVATSLAVPLRKFVPVRATPNATTKRAPARPAARSDHAAERRALEQAYAGARRLEERSRIAGPAAEAARGAARPSDSDAAARLMLAALVMDFEVERESDGWVRGSLRGCRPTEIARLKDGRAKAEAETDLHGQTVAEARRHVARFVHAQYRNGLRLLRIVHGKGLHSDGGLGVLGDAVVEALTHGESAHLVVAFQTTALDQGGTGALLVALRSS